MSKKKDKQNNRKQEQERFEFDTFGYEEYRKPPKPDAADRKRMRLREGKERITSGNRARLVGGFAVLLLLMFALIGRMGYWQIVRADELREMAVQMQKVDTEIEPVRGAIYDSKMSTLAETVTEYELYAYSQYLYKSDDIPPSEKASTLKKMVEITGVDSETLLQRLTADENLVLVAEGLTREQIERAQKVWGNNISVKTKVTRYYPNGAFAAQILGGVNADNVGRSGLEYEYNSVLAGMKGRTVRTTDRDGNTLSGSKTKYYEPKDGDSIVTTIDSVIQHFVEEALETGMKKTGAEAITCIVMDPKTGDILAMAMTPEYDPNKSSQPYTKTERDKFAKMTQEEQTEYLSRMWTVRGVSNVYEPGSTFKLITAASALESNTSDENSRYKCNGAIHVGNYNLRCLGVHGTQTLKEAVGNSCNPGMARVALDMGADTFYSYIDMFGFNDKTGVDLPGEANSIVKSPVNMGDVDLATTGYGQGIAVTPLQILSAVNCFGNDGVLMQPKLVKKIVDREGNTVREIEDKAVRQVVSSETAAELRDIMEYYVAEGGGGDRAYVPGFRVGGKTGTADLVEGGSYSKKSTNTSFVAMAPMDDPLISMIVIVYKPTKIRFGNLTAGPIVKEIMEKSLQYLGVERMYTKEEAKAAKKELIKVPDVTGMNSKKAKKLLKNYGLKYTVMPEGNGSQEFAVIDQYPKAGTKVEKNTTVYLYSE